MRWGYKKPILPAGALNYDTVKSVIEAVMPDDLMFDISIERCAELPPCRQITLQVYDSQRDTRPDYQDTVQTALETIQNVTGAGPTRKVLFGEHETYYIFHLILKSG